MIFLIFGLNVASAEIRTCLKKILNVFGSISTKTGIQFQCKIAVAQAHMVQGVQIISSPGEGSIAPTEQIRPDVHEFTEIA